MESLKNDTSKLIHKTEADTQTWKTNLWLQAGGEGLRRGTDWEFRTDVYTLLYLNR